MRAMPAGERGALPARLASFYTGGRLASSPKVRRDKDLEQAGQCGLRIAEWSRLVASLYSEAITQSQTAQSQMLENHQ